MKSDKKVCYIPTVNNTSSTESAISNILNTTTTSDGKIDPNAFENIVQTKPSYMTTPYDGNGYKHIGCFNMGDKKQ